MIAFCFIVICLVAIIGGGGELLFDEATIPQTPAAIRTKCEELLTDGRSADLLTFLSAVQRSLGTLAVDRELPSLYNYKAVALFDANRLEDAGAALNQAVRHIPTDLRAWVNLVEVRKVADFAGDVYEAIDMVEQLSGSKCLDKYFMLGDWRDLEAMIKDKERAIMTCIDNTTEHNCMSTIVSGVSYTGLNGTVTLRMLQLFVRDSLSSDTTSSSCSSSTSSTNSSSSISSSSGTNSVAALHQNRSLYEAPQLQISLSMISQTHLRSPKHVYDALFNPPANLEAWTGSSSFSSVTSSDHRRLRVGFLMAQMDGGPIGQLTQSLFRHLDRGRVEVVGILLATSNDAPFQWLKGALRSFDAVLSLDGLDLLQAARLISSADVDILIDLNGLRISAGLMIMQYRPCRIQVQYLGDPVSSGADFIDYYIGDRVASPPDAVREHFVEKLVLLNTCYLTNSYKEWAPDVQFRTRKTKRQYVASHLNHADNDTPRLLEHFYPQIKGNSSDISNSHQRQQQRLLFGAFHGYSKIDPLIFQVWMNVLSRRSGSALVMTHYNDGPRALANYRRYAALSGMPAERVLSQRLGSWYEHHHVKSAVDVFLDTRIKNGHTTVLDAVWSGVPVVALAGGRAMPARSTETVMHHMDATMGMAYSLKEYEDLAAYELLRGRRSRHDSNSGASSSDWLIELRQHFERKRSAEGSVFDAATGATSFAHSMHAIYEASALAELLLKHEQCGSSTETCFHRHVINRKSREKTPAPVMFPKFHIFYASNGW